MKHLAATMLVLAAAASVGAQENVPLLQDHGTLTERILQPITPRLPLPAPTLPHAGQWTQPIKPDRHIAGLSDTLRLYDRLDLSGASATMRRQRFEVTHNLYSHNWSHGGMVAPIGHGYLAGTSSFVAMPALGNVGSATLSLTQPMGERLVVTVGLTGNKYHFGRAAWNTYGVFGNASFRLNEQLTLNAFAQHYWNQRVPGVAALPYLADTRYGGTLGVRMSETVSLDVGAQRYYDPYTRQWKTVPILAPTVRLMGQPISVDVGGLLYQILDNLLGSKRDYSGYNHEPGFGTGIHRSGFNPNSPIRIPDALR